MKVKGRSLLVIALLLFGGYAYYDYYQEQKTSETKMEESRLMLVPYDQVDRVEIKKPDEKILLTRSVDGWALQEPLKDNASNEDVDDYVKSLATEKILDVAKEGEDIDWTVYGLEKPAAIITLTTTAGKSDSFEVSDKKNFEDNVFARRNKENRVLVLNSIWEKKAHKTNLDFRDRRFLRHKIGSVDQIKLKNKAGLLHIKMIDGRWTAPMQEKIALDQNKVRDLLQAIADAKGSQYLEKKDLPSLKPLFTLDLVMDKKTWKAQVGQAKDFAIYAEVSDPEFRMKMEPGALDKLIAADYKSLKSDAPPKDHGADDEHQAMIADKKEKRK